MGQDETAPKTQSAQPSAGVLSLPFPAGVVEAIAERAAQIVGDRHDADSAPYLSVDEAAEFLRCGRKRIYDLTGQHRLPFVKDGSRTLLRRTDLIAYLEGSA